MANGGGPAGPISAVQGFVSNVVSTVTAPVDALNLAVAQATLEVLKFLPKMPAARLYTDLVFQFGHSHPHPPSFGIPIPSVGPVLASGCMSVLINGLPSARNGDLGLAVWCGGYFPIFEIITGSSHVFMGGARAARQVMDVTLHCLPDPFGGKWGIGKLDIAMAVFGVGMSALNTAAAVEGAIVAQEVASESQGTADAEAAAAAAAAAGVGAGVAAAQLAADAAATAMGLLMGKDPGVGFPFGMITMGSPNVLVGGFPMPGWMTILKGLGKLLKPVIRKVQVKLPPGKLRNSLCALTGHPVDVASGRMFTSQTDFEIDGRIPIRFDRLYDTSSIDYESTLGWGWTHPYDQHLWESKRYNCLVLRNEENRQVRFDKLKIGERYFQPLERVWLKRTDESEYELFDCKNGLFYKFGKTSEADFTSEKTALRLTEIFNRNGNRLKLKYDGDLLTEINGETGDFVTFHYHDSAGRTRLFEIRHHLKNGQSISLMKFGYNSDSELISAADRTYVPYTYNYENHLITRETNRNGLSFHFEYEGEGQNARCIYTYGDGGIYERRLTYLPKAKITKVKDGLGGETIYHYNDLDLVTKIFNAEGGIIHYEYGDFGELLKETDEVGRVRAYSYDEQLNRTESVQADGSKRSITYDQFCKPISYVEQSGAEWKREYDERGNLTAAMTPLGARREYVYDRFGDMIVFRDALGNETLLEWTNKGQISSVTHPNGGKTVYAYNERDLLGEITEEFTKTKIRYLYDDAARIKKLSEINARNELVNFERYEYDDQGNVILAANILGHKTVYKYSGHNKLAERIDALGFSRKFKYNREEYLTEFINERGESFSFEYDRSGRIVEETSFDGKRKSYRYNQAGELVYQKDALERETFYRYDENGQLVTRLCSNAVQINFAYDSCGRLISARNGHSETKYVFDDAWRLVSESQNGQLISFEYDDENRRLSRKVTVSGKTVGLVKYAYDPEGNLSKVNIGENSIVLQRDKLGRIIEKLLPNGLEERFEYDSGGKLSSQKISVGNGKEILKRSFAWNEIGNITHIADTLRGSRSYGYDANERLTRVERPFADQTAVSEKPQDKFGKNGEIPVEKRIWQADDRFADIERSRELEEFRYDGDGNLTERSSSVQGSRNFSYGRADKLEQQDKIRYLYDAVGNLIQKQIANGEAIRYEYDGDNQLIAYSKENGEKVRFKYDAFGRRIAKIDEKGTTEFLWDGDVLLGEFQNDFCEYVYENFVPLARIENSQIQNYHTDYLGTPKELSNSDGNLIWQGTYDEYGKITALKAQTSQPIRFQNQYEDAETGLYYNRFRYYDAENCRYLNQDPIEFRGGTAFYQYTTNPLNYVDPFGLNEWLPGQPKPKGWRLPKSGTWAGERGHSDFTPSNPTDLGLNPGDTIPYKNGRPDFSKWSQRNMTVNGMTGDHDVDMPMIHRQLAADMGLPNQTAAKNWLSTNGLTPHHDGGNRVILVPTSLHDGIRHTGGAYELRNRSTTDSSC